MHFDAQLSKCLGQGAFSWGCRFEMNTPLLQQRQHAQKRVRATIERSIFKEQENLHTADLKQTIFGERAPQFRFANRVQRRHGKPQLASVTTEHFHGSLQRNRVGRHT